MLFPTVEYALFFLVAFAVAWGLVRWPRWHKGFLLISSWGFYAYGDWRFLPLLIGLSLEAAFIARALERTTSSRARGWILGLGVSGALITLGLFKYLTFFGSVLVSLLHGLGVSLPSAHVPELALPIGLSFFAFHAISLMVDAWRGKIPVKVEVLDALLYVAFFPQLVAGPILRASSFLPVLARPPEKERVDVALALQRLAWGLFKKVVLAQVLASTLVDPVFEAPSEHSSVEVWWAVYGYAAQIFCDFSGYTDLAIGSALLLGYTMPENFDAPYLAPSPQAFWRRWHLSLSSWLRDYLFIPLGGSRAGTVRTALALAATMVLGGLWHGAAWTFVAWGAFHAAGLIIHRAWAAWPAVRVLRERRWWTVVATLLTFHFVCIGWVFFRASSWSVVREVGSTVMAGTTGGLPAWRVMFVLLALAASALGWESWAPVRERFARWPPVAQGAAFAVLLVGLDALGPRGVAPFIYFQF